MSPKLERHLSLLATFVVLVALYATASLLYPGFFSAGVLVNILTDNAALGITAVGLTLVIFSGGIDLSVGAVVGFTSIFVATLVQQRGFHPLAASGLAVAAGAALGAGMGATIHFFRQPPFLITLAGMFLMRGCAYWITTDSRPIEHPFFVALTGFVAPLGGAFSLPTTALALLAVLAMGGTIAHYTRFGRNLLALGGSESSALLMGLPTGPTKIGVYTLNGACAAVAGVVGTIYTGAGNPTLGLGLELDAIAVVVIGGTLLTGGRGHMLGTLLGILIFGTIQSALLFDGRLNSAWIRIVVGLLLLTFILLQRFLVRGAIRRPE
jgi:simple sugar transport system permease protein